jgi:hypothetical protein
MRLALYLALGATLSGLVVVFAYTDPGLPDSVGQPWAALRNPFGVFFEREWHDAPHNP